MVKVIRRTPLGIQSVYDIGVASEDHNFLLDNGLVASNCFNKSHSTAYGYVTYQTAYLKAHYPVEYMAALITANSGDQDKVQRYIASCLGMNIEVLPPDINQSGIDFTPRSDRILFGLSGVRNVGMGAIEAIIASREEKGRFTSLPDLCDRIDGRSLNKRALESLIHCGALDSIDQNRHQLFKDLELVVDWAQSRAKDRLSGQGNLFDLLGGGGDDAPQGGLETAPKAPPVEDYPSQERLRLEKEVLGFYISDHPLKDIRESSRVLAPISLGNVSAYADRSVSAIVMVTTVKNVTTKKGDAMAIPVFEDLTGQVEAVVFPKSYALIGHLIKPDARLIVWGKVDRQDDDRIQFIVEDAEAIEQVRMVMVELDPTKAEDVGEQHRLRNILVEESSNRTGKIPVIAILGAPGHQRLVRFGNQFRVKDDRSTVNALIQAGFSAKTSALVPA
ncbi:MAG: trans-splicing intein-formed DNA polymerase III subunit alpha C-terminal partner DnaE-C [Alkalinema sp. RU_4_3]|nr:trans-splicing intein-formed DNA polymerase III subunit alpha C-terminal partner DnaE-C [Alkalinema sp. RU_4_3]